MSRIWSMMDVGKRALMNSQTALQTTGHNIANKSTDGYSRQRVEQVSNVPIGEGKLRIGTGARNLSIRRVNNPYIERQLIKEEQKSSYNESRSVSLGRVEQVFNEQLHKGLNKYMGDFFNSFRELANNPESLATRTLVKEAADFLAKDFHRVIDHLDQVQSDVDYQILTLVQEVNEMTKEVASLNEKIHLVEMQGANANDERDRRDLLLKRLGKKVNIRHSEGDGGQVTITAGRTALLVSGFSQRDLFATSTPEREGKSAGNFDVFYRSSKNGTPINVTSQITGGSIGGLLDIRDRVIQGIKEDVDLLAYTTATAVNDIHKSGYDRLGRKGMDFFEVPKTVKGASTHIRLSQAVYEDVGRIAAAAQKDSPGDNRVANIISLVQYTKPLKGGSFSVDDFYSSIVGQIGIESQRAQSSFKSQDNLVKQLTKIRESISGVSLDEETAKMIEYQKSYDASARLIRTADEMMDTILSLKRM